jgi:hypothetical protein
MTNSITPPPELVQQLLARFHTGDTLEATWAIAFRAGADQELEACIADIHTMFGKGHADWLRSLRRPKPPSLKEQAYDALDTYIYGEPDPKDKERTYNTIRRALEALPND